MRRSRRGGSVVLGLVAIGVIGCSVEARTQVIVQIEADRGVAARIDGLHVVVSHLESGRVPTGSPALDETVSIGRLAGDVALPAHVPLIPRFDDAERRFEVVAEALEDDEVIAIVRARSGYVRHETRLLVLRFEDSCIEMLDCDENTCRDGRCTSAEVDPRTLPPYSPSARDAGMDARIDANDARVEAGADAADAGDAGDARDAGDAAMPSCTSAAQCDDGDPCTTDTCPRDLGECRSARSADGTQCGDARAQLCCGGTCTDTSTDALACGSCGRACGPGASCAAGECVCTSPLLDCDGAPGCESDPRIDPANCGGCRDACSAPTPSCVAGDCTACGSAADCADDGLTCTGAPTCTDGACTYPLSDASCLIAGVCVASDAVNPANPCEACQRGIDQRAWSPRTGASCDDGLYCTETDSCSAAGACVGGTARDCDDSLACTNDVCSEATDRCTSTLSAGRCLVGGTCYSETDPDPTDGCRWCQPSSATDRFVVRSGAMCDDGLFCTSTDRCSASGTCTGSPMSCVDGLTCTTGTCNEATNTCDQMTNAGRCLIGGACFLSGASNPANGCQVCDPDASQSAWTRRASGTSCNDGMYCTVGDACDGMGMCASTPRNCDDSDPCTIDSCDEAISDCTWTGCGPSQLCTGTGCVCTTGTADCDGMRSNGCECGVLGCSGTMCAT